MDKAEMKKILENSEPIKKVTVKLDIDTEEIVKVIQKELDRQIKSQNT